MSTFYKYVNGDIIDADEHNNNNSEVISLSLKNAAREAIDHAQVFSTDSTDLVSEGFIDANGQNNSVNAGNTTAKIIPSDANGVTSNITKNTAIVAVNDEASGDTTHDTGGFTNPSNAFDNDDSTEATKATGSIGIGDFSLGKTFTAKTVSAVYYKIRLTQVSGNDKASAKLQTYDGASWNDVLTIFSGSIGSVGTTRTYYGVVDISSSVQGVRIRFDKTNGTSGSQTYGLYSLEYGDLTTSIVELDLPSGTFSATVSKLQGTAITDNWETGASINCKLKNATEDSGWLPINEIGSFTAFTTQPTKAQFQLVPKSTSPTVGFPSIKAVSIKGWD